VNFSLSCVSILLELPNFAKRINYKYIIPFPLLAPAGSWVETMDPLRQDLLNQLAAIGVVLPKGTKMPNDALEKRLNQALDASQTFTEIITCVPFNPTGLNTWSSSTHSESLIQAVQRGNLIEAMRNASAASQQIASGQSLVKHPKAEDTFMEVRQCMLQFAKHWEDGISVFVLQDEAQESGIILRVRRVCLQDYAR
jgi:hypothetical protein